MKKHLGLCSLRKGMSNRVSAIDELPIILAYSEMELVGQTQVILLRKVLESMSLVQLLAKLAYHCVIPSFRTISIRR